MVGVDLVQTSYNVGLFTASWTMFYFLVASMVVPKRTVDYKNRVVSLVHAIVASWLCIRTIELDQLGTRIGHGITPSELLCLTASLGYFLYDLLYCAFVEQSPENTLHHLATIAGLVVGVYQHKCGEELVLCLLLMEVSNPFMHLRAMLKELGLKDSQMALINEVTFAATFFICRGVIGPFLVYRTVMAQEGNIIVKAGALGIQAISAFWLVRIFKVVAHKLRKSSKASSSKSQ